MLIDGCSLDEILAYINAQEELVARFFTELEEEVVRTGTMAP